MLNNCDSCIFLKDNKLLILETEFWKILLSPNQHYLGRSYITLKRHCGDLDKLTNNEWGEFILIVKKLEFALRKTFNATMFNWTCLMNNAYQKKNPIPHIHWHFRPRYNQGVIFEDISFTDSEFGHHYIDDTRKNYFPPQKVLLKIVKEIKKYLTFP